MAAAEPAVDALASLEARILKAVELVAKLRSEKETALREGAEARAQVAKLTEELQGLQAERREVCGRIEKLLGQIDQLSANS